MRHDPGLVPGYPKSVDRADGDAAPTYADLEGRHELDLIVPNGNGEVNAWRPDGTEVPGFPVHTATLKQLDPLNPENYRARAYGTANLANVLDPLSGGAAVGDLFHNGELEIVVTSTNGQVYAWDSHGRPLPGCPVGQDPANWEPFTAVPTPRAATDHSRNPDRGNWSPPVLADLEGTGQLDILMTAFDGFVYAFRPDGTPAPGWPVEIELPASYFTDQGGTVDPGRYIRDAKLMYPVTVADVLDLGAPQVFVPSFESNGQGSSTEDLAESLLGFNPSNDAAATWLYGLYADGNDHPGGPYIHPPDGTWPVTVQRTSFTYEQSIVASLQVPGVANLPQVYEKAWDPRDGQVLPGWPKRVDGFPFYASPITADVAGLGLGRSAIEGNDTYFIHAFQASGLEAPGFPKYTGQWEAFAGVVADPSMNGQLVYTIPTREGFVFTWKVAGDTALNDSWWHYRHDESNTGAYGVDTRRPASILDLRVVRGPQPQLAWTAPGDDYMVGAADRYDVRWSNQPITSSSFWSATPLAGAPAPQPAGSPQSMAVGGVSGSTVYFAIRSVDSAGNISALSNAAW